MRLRPSRSSLSQLLFLDIQDLTHPLSWKRTPVSMAWELSYRKLNRTESYTLLPLRDELSHLVRRTTVLQILRLSLLFGPYLIFKAISMDRR